MHLYRYYIECWLGLGWFWCDSCVMGLVMGFVGWFSLWVIWSLALGVPLWVGFCLLTC